MKDFDVILVGSGIGGLVCAEVLGRAGYSVCVLEKNRQIGGALQTFVRGGVIFDSGVHYLGGLDKGQNLYQLFKYLGIMDRLRLEKMDEDGFDRIGIAGESKTYPLAQGYERFISRLAEEFPGEESALRTYCQNIQDTCERFPLYNLRTWGAPGAKEAVLETGARELIDSLTPNPRLRAVLAGNNILYAGRGQDTPFYVHALILNSYIQSAWKCPGGGSQIARLLARNIRSRGGIIRREWEAARFRVEQGRVVAVEGVSGETLSGDHFISNLHPARTLDMTETDLVRKVYRKRLQHLDNTVSCFSLNLTLKPGALSYRRHNLYIHREGRIWDMDRYTPENWPLGFAVFFSAREKDPEFCESVSILTYMHYEEVLPWADTVNTEASEADRGPSYEEFKRRKGEILLDAAELQVPGLRAGVESVFSATPLSYRDYLGSADGSMYGIAKDYHDPVKTLVPVRTKLPNLYFTGQNLNLHGILGSTISAMLTCAELVDLDELMEKVVHA